MTMPSSFFSPSKKLNRRGVFGLTSVQQFFALLLGVALLAYVIVVILGTLDGAPLIADLSRSITNESGGFINGSGYLLTNSTVLGFSNPAIVIIHNGTSGVVVPSGNYTLTAANRLINATAILFQTVNVSYTYNYNSESENQVDRITSNVSAGVSGFFGSINPVFAILAIMVIILVLVVLVRVVSGDTFSAGRASSGPQL